MEKKRALSIWILNKHLLLGKSWRSGHDSWIMGRARQFLGFVLLQNGLSLIPLCHCPYAIFIISTENWLSFNVTISLSLSSFTLPKLLLNLDLCAFFPSHPIRDPLFCSELLLLSFLGFEGLIPVFLGILEETPFVFWSIFGTLVSGFAFGSLIRELIVGIGGSGLKHCAY